MKALMKSYSQYRHIFTSLLCLTAAFFIAGCVLIINQPSVEEKELMTIQETVGNQMADVSQKMSSGTYSNDDLGNFITEAEDTISQAIQRINELKIPEKTQKFAEETKKYLDYATKIFKELKDLLKDIDRLKAESIKLGEQADKILAEQIKNIQNGIDFFGKKIDETAKSLTSVRDEIQKLYNSSN